MNKFVNNHTQDMYLLIDEMRGTSDEENDKFYTNVLQSKHLVKTVYLALKFNKIGKKFYPQINNISMTTPSSPVLFDWDSISFVICLYISIKFLN